MVDRSKTIDKQSKLYFLVAGEESGDLHGSELIKEIKNAEPGARFLGIGGDKMAAEGMDVLFHAKDLAIVGFIEVLKHLSFFKKVMRETLTAIRSTSPERVILIDYPGFNLRLAKKIKPFGIPVTYFILPQVWAWKENRVKSLIDYTDQCISIMPFEKDWFEKRGLKVMFSGHPFVEEINGDLPSGEKIEHQRLLLLPGSRQQEVDRHLPVFLEVADKLRAKVPELKVSIGKAPNISTGNLPNWVSIESGKLIDKMSGFTAAITASGTATLEVAVSNLPEVVCYKLSYPSWLLAKLLVKVKYASIVNVIADNLIVPEFIQGNMIPEKIAPVLLTLLSQTPERKNILAGYDIVRSKLGEKGVYRRAASFIIEGTEG